MVKHAQILARFSRDFGAPFLLGQPALVGSPLGQDGLLAIRNGLGIDNDLADACDRQFEQAAHFADVTPAPFDEDAGTLLYAVHELFACTHPQASAFYARAHLFCRAASQAVLELPRTLDPHRLLTRHLIVERAFATTRDDVFLKWWTGSASFFGEEAPTRLTAWPQLRRVNVDKKTTPMWRLALSAGDEELRAARAALITALLDTSPLTRLVMLGDPLQKSVGFSLVLPYRLGGKKVSPLDCLDDRPLARGVVDKLIDRGIDVVGPPLALTLLQSLREGNTPRILRRAAELCTHLAICACLIEADAPGARESKPLRAFLDDDVNNLNEALRVYWAVVASTLALDGTVFDVPSPADLPDKAAPLWAQLRARLNHKRLLAVAEPLRRELARRLPSPQPPA